MDGTTINEKPFSDPITLWRSSIGTRWRGGEKDIPVAAADKLH